MILAAAFSWSLLFGSVALVLPTQEVHAQTSLQTLIKNLKAQGMTAEEVRQYAKQYNITAEDLINAGYTVEDLKDAGFSAQELKDAGLTIDDLKAAGFTSSDLKDAGFTIQDLRNAGYSVRDLQSAGFTLKDLQASGVTIQDMRSGGISVSELRQSGFSVQELKTAGVTNRELLNGGYSISELRTAGLTATQLKEAGANASDLRSAGFSVSDLKNAGYTANELRSAGASLADLKNAGYTAVDLRNAGASGEDLKTLGFTYAQMRDAGLSASELKTAGASATELKNVGFTSSQLLAAGYTGQQLKDAGYSLADLKNAGLSLQQLRSLGATPAELKEAGYNVGELKTAGLSASELKAAGFSAEELYLVNFSLNELKEAGVTAAELRTLGAAIEDLKNAGYTNEELLAAGFSESEVGSTGDSIKDLLAAGKTPAELLAEGATVRDLMNAGVSLNDLKDAGVKEKDLLEAGASVQQLIGSGSTVNDLLAAGVTVDELRNAGVSTQELVNSGIDVAALLESGVSVSDLRKAGAQTRELIAAGVSTQELLDAGVTNSDLLSAGVTASELLAAGQTPRSLIEAGVPIQTLKNEGVTVAQLVESGVSASALISSGVSASELLEAGVTTRDMIDAGTSAADLKQAGLSAEELKSNGVSNRDLVTAGYKPDELMQAGLTTQDMVVAGANVNDLKEAGISNRALLEAGVSPRDLKNAGATLEELATLGLTDNDLKLAGFTDTEIADYRTGGGGGDDDGPPDIDDLIKSELAAKILNDGEQCIADSANDAAANSCRSSGSRWNCDMKICYTEEFRADVINDGVNCYESETDKTRQEACVEDVKGKAVYDYAAGAMCDNTTTEATECAGAGKVYNCNINQCLTAQQNHSMAQQVRGCYSYKDVAARETCLKETEVNVAIDLMSNCDTQSNPEAVMCRRDPNKSWNCMANTCLDKEFNNNVTAQTRECLLLEGAAKDQCLEDVKLGVVRHIASGESCDQNSSQARECSSQGKVYNCNVGYCLTESQNNEITDGIVRCESESETEEARDTCLADLKREAITRVASGEMCDKTTTEAMACTAQGKIYNCNVNACLTVEENLLLTDRIVACELETPGPAERNACYKDIKEEAVRYVASGQNCDQTTDEAVACAGEGKIWNCNVNFCLTEEQNNVLADEIVKCQMMDNVNLKDMCMADLEDNAIDFMMRACDISDNPKAQDCKNRGRVWNCQVNMCLSETDHARLVRAVKNCNAKPTKEEQQACHDELEEFAKMAEDGNGLDSDKIKMPNNPGKMIHGGIAAGGLAATLINMGPSKKCYSGVAVGIAGVLAMVNEMNTDKTAEAAMKNLQERVKAMEERVKKEDASFELQVEVFEFSLRAIDEGIQIAKQKDSGYGMVLGMYAAAMAATAIEIAMAPWNPPIAACGAVNIGLSALGMATVGMIKSAINKGIADLEAQRARVQSIYDRFLHHFGGHGGLATERNRKPPKGGDYASTDNPLTNIALNPNKPRNLSNSQGLERPEGAQLPRSCANSNGELDSGCECAKTDSCMKLEGFGAGATAGSTNASLQSMAASLPTDAIINDTNKILGGELNAGEIKQAVINQRNDRLKNVLDQIKDKTNENLVKMGESPMKDPTEDDVFNFLEKNLKTPVAQRSSATQDVGGIDVDGLLASAPGLSKDLSDQLKELAADETPPGAGIMPPFNFEPFKFDNMENVMLKNQLKDGENLEEALADRPEWYDQSKDPYEYHAGSSQVHGDSKLNLFHIISNRYNVLRMNKRLGPNSDDL